MILLIILQMTKKCYPDKDILILITYRNAKYGKVLYIGNNNVIHFYSRNQNILNLQFRLNQKGNIRKMVSLYLKNDLLPAYYELIDEKHFKKITEWDAPIS